jgi:hypothetical protein
LFYHVSRAFARGRKIWEWNGNYKRGFDAKYSGTASKDQIKSAMVRTP